MQIKPIVIVLLAIACNDGAIQQDNSRGKRSGKSEASPKSNDLDKTEAATNPGSYSGPLTPESTTETVAVPFPISGTFLHCANLAAAINSVPTAVVGCRLEDSNSTRILPSIASVKTTYSFQIPSDPSTLVSMRIAAESDALYDAYFNITNEKYTAANTASSNLTIRVEVQHLTSGEAPSVLSGTVAELLVPPSSPLTEWTEICIGTVCDYRDNITGLFWSPSNTARISWAESQQRCASYKGLDPRSKWRQPTALELTLANAHNMMTNAATKNAQIVSDWSYWSTTQLPDSYQAGEIWVYATFFTSNGNRGVGTANRSNFLLNSLCVRE